jgi:hypothetical protein
MLIVGLLAVLPAVYFITKSCGAVNVYPVIVTTFAAVAAFVAHVADIAGKMVSYVPVSVFTFMSKGTSITS